MASQALQIVNPERNHRKLLLASLFCFLITTQCSTGFRATVTGESANLSDKTEGTDVSQPLINSWTYPDAGLTIVQADLPLNFHYDPDREKSLKTLTEEDSACSAINSSYFEADGRHAGLLMIQGLRVAPYKEDRQLSTIVALDPRRAVFEILDANPSIEEGVASGRILFQAGPVLFRKGTYDSVAVGNSVNGNSPHLRTLLAETDGKVCYFIICTREVTLPELAEHLPRLDCFRGKSLDVVNLDGGSSTALACPGDSVLNFRPDRKLPLVLTSGRIGHEK